MPPSSPIRGDERAKAPEFAHVLIYLGEGASDLQNLGYDAFGSNEGPRATRAKREPPAPCEKWHEAQTFMFRHP